jgi:hypothetical protein
MLFLSALKWVLFYVMRLCLGVDFSCYVVLIELQ